MIDLSESRLTVAEAAALLGVNARTVHQYFRRGLRHHAYSRKNVWTSKEAIEEFNARKSSPTQAAVLAKSPRERKEATSLERRAERLGLVIKRA
jgi:predicted site-specific integrase-resolvase